MHGQRAIQLVRELRVGRNLPAYDDAGVRQVANEIRDLFDVIMQTKENMLADQSRLNEKQCSSLVHLRSVQRNKRCVLAYLVNRLRRIQTSKWEVGAAMHADDWGSNISSLERQFLQRYNDILGDYCDQVELDITAEIQPPEDMYIEVRVLRDCGEILTDDGSLLLKKGTAHYVRRSDVEHLIRQGALKHIDCS